MKKENISILFSILSIICAISVWVLWICNVWKFSVVSLDSFVGVMIAILGILVTFAIAWQIINALELKSKITEIEQLKPELEKLESQLLGIASISKAEMGNMLASQAMNQKQLVLAFQYIHKSLLANVLAPVEYAIYVSSNLQLLDKITTSLEQEIITKETWEITKKTEKEIREAANFNLIKEQYNTIMSEFYRKVHYEE